MKGDQRRVESRSAGIALLAIAPLAAVAAAALAIMPAGAAAQAATRGAGLTLAEAVERAMSYYPSVGAARHAAEGAERGVEVAAATRWPSLGVTGSAVSYQEQMLVRPLHGFTPSTSPEFSRGLLQGAASLRYTVFDGFARGARVAAAQSEADAAREDLDGTVEGLLARVSAAYLDAYAGARVLAAMDRRLAALEAERDRVRVLLEVGRAAQVDLLRVEAALAAAVADRVSQSSAVEVAEQSLSRLTGIPVDSTRAAYLGPVLLQDTAIASRDELLGVATQGNAMVRRSRLQASAAQSRVALARSGRMPRLDLAANYSTWASVDHDPVAEWNVGVVVSWPLFTGGAAGQEVRRNEAAAAAAAERSRMAESELADALDRALSAVREAGARVASLTTAVARSAEVARIEQLRLEAGTGVQRDFLDAEAALFANRAALGQAESAAVMARIELARVTGRLDVDWLRGNSGGTP